MRTDLFDFVLPEDRIALRPAVPRDSARLLVVRPGASIPLADRTMRDLPALLREGDAVVVNDTKVIPASLHGRRIGRGEHEPAVAATLTRRLDGSRWKALVKPGKRLAVGDVVRFGSEGRVCFLDQLDATVEAKGEGGEVTFAFAFHGPVLDQALAERGDVPLPPYIASRRPADEQDRTDYQTVFAREDGSVAAPTAGLHFTPELLERIEHAFLTLHVGAGTFKPVKEARVTEHRLHREEFEVTPDAAARIQAARKVLAVGTTTVRTLETLMQRFDRIESGKGVTDIFIYPPFRFRRVDSLLTNFHLPKSTLLMLVAAFAGRELILKAYREAVKERYRFFSYGDCMLIR